MLKIDLVICCVLGLGFVPAGLGIVRIGFGLGLVSPWPSFHPWITCRLLVLEIVRITYNRRPFIRRNYRAPARALLKMIIKILLAVVKRNKKAQHWYRLDAPLLDQNNTVFSMVAFPRKSTTVERTKIWIPTLDYPSKNYYRTVNIVIRLLFLTTKMHQIYFTVNQRCVSPYLNNGSANDDMDTTIRLPGEKYHRTVNLVNCLRFVALCHDGNALNLFFR